MLAGAALLLGAQGASAAWQNIGKGLYRDDLISALYVVEPMEWEVEVEESDKTPGLYSIVNPYRNSPYKIGEELQDGDNFILIHAEDPDHVWLGLSATGLKINGGYLVAYSVAGDYYENVYGDFGMADREGMCGKLRDGIITFTTPRSLLINVMEEPNGAPSTWMTANSSGMFRLRLPGAPLYEANLSTSLEGSDVVANVSLERDVEYALVAIAEGDDAAGLRAAIIDGTAQAQRIDASTTLRFTLEHNGQYTVMAVPFYQGQPKDEASVTKEYDPFEEGWRRAKEMAVYTDGILSGIGGDDPERSHDNVLNMESWVGSVPVEYSLTNPGQIRLVDPFGPETGCPYSNDNTYDTSKHYYMMLDISDPQCVLMDKMDPIGLTLPYGKVILWGRPGYGVWQYGWEVGDANYKAHGGHLNGTTLTFGKGDILAKFPKINDGKYAWYWANFNLETEIQLPQEVIDNSAIGESRADTAPGQAVYYNLQGQRVANPQGGVYVRVRDGKATKVVK